MGVMKDGLPLTGCGDFAKAPATEVRAAIGKLCRELFAGQKITENAQGARTLNQAIDFLDPAAEQLTRCVVLDTKKAGWVGVYGNAIGGHPLASFLAIRLKTDAVGFGLEADTAKRKGRNFVGAFGEVRLDIFTGGKRTREIGASNQLGKWRFGHDGKPLPFEEVRSYKAASARDRFTPAMLLQYLAALGLRPFDEDFFVVNAKHAAQSVTVAWTTEENEAVPLTDLRERSGLTAEVIADLFGGAETSTHRRTTKRR